MRKSLSLILLLVAGCMALFCFTFSLYAQDIPWDKFREVGDDPGAKVFKDYALVENVPLIAAAVQNIPAEDFAIASLLRFFEITGNAKYPFLDAPLFLSQNMNPILDELIETPTLDKKKTITDQLETYLNSYRKEARSVAEKARILEPTDGQLLALLLYKTSTDPDEALQKILYGHFYVVKRLRKLKADQQVAKVLLNIVLLRGHTPAIDSAEKR